jgi:hypothetical protein
MQNQVKAEIRRRTHSAVRTASRETRYLRIALSITLVIWIVFTRIGAFHLWLTIICGVVGAVLASFLILRSWRIGRRLGHDEVANAEPKNSP